MTIIDSETVVVYDYNELKTVLEGNNTYNLVYFGADITLDGGIILNPAKTSLTIDGTYDNVRYTYTDYNSTNYNQTILLTNTPTSMNITVQNIDVIGRNYYGVICVYDATGFSNVVVNYININYTGPQLAFNPYSSLNIINCNIIIQASSASSANEVAETRNVTLGGTTNINSSATGNSIFWFRNVVGGVYPYLNVMPNANITTATGMGYDNSHLTGKILIDNNAILNIKQNQQFGSAATWCINNELKMNSGSSLKMVSDYTGSTSNYCILFSTTSSALNLNNPKSVVLYNKSASAIYSSSTIPYMLNISQYNRWTAVTPYLSAGDIYDIPTYSWYKLENVNNLVMSGNITSSTTTISSTNLTSAEESQLPNLSNFLINNTRVLSIGRPSLSINPITDLTTDITGVTSPGADVRISYDGNDYYVQADSNGNYIYTYSTPLPIGTEISFVSNVANSFLYRFRTVEVIYAGDLSIVSATNQVIFSTTSFQTTPYLCNRVSPLKVVVNDSRIIPTVWNLYAFINQELTNEKGRVLTDGLVYVDNIDNMTVLSETPTLVYTSDGVTTGEIDVEWPDNEGILLQLNVVPIVKDTVYQTDINWHLE